MAHRRAANRERQAAAILGSRRVLRSRYESAPDVEPVTLPSGIRLAVEVKTRARLPRLIAQALAQAKGYGRASDVPCAVLSETGGEPVAVLPLRAFRRIAGLDPDAPLPADLGQGLGTDERRVLEAIGTRLHAGADCYGALRIETDPRDWRKEAAEEALDLAVYLAAELLRREAP
jgi:hypothetical protein